MNTSIVTMDYFPEADIYACCSNSLIPQQIEEFTIEKVEISIYRPKLQPE